MKRFRLLVLCAAAAAVSACAGRSYCTGDYPYQHARSVPPLRSATGVEVPKSSTAMEIPPPPPDPVPYAERYQNERGHTMVRCLDEPQPLPPPTNQTPAKGE